MLVREIMTSPAYSVLQDAPLDEALKLMAKSRVTGLPVVDSAGRVVGIITEADLLKADLEHDARAHIRPAAPTSEHPAATVAQVMTQHPHTVREDSDVADLAHTFAHTSWKSVPVVRGDRLLGVVSRSDVIRALARPDQEIESEISDTLAEAGLRSWHVKVTDGVAQLTGTTAGREQAAATSIAHSVMGVRQVISGHPDA